MGIWNTVQKWQGKSVPPCSMIVAAAGSSCRMGGQDKLLAPLAGVPVLTHAVMDALLGAIAAGDIGKLFPDNDAAFHNISSMLLLKRVGEYLRQEGYTVVNIDATLIAQAPKVSPYRDAMRQNIAAALGVDVSQISVKATTEEHLGFTGTGEGMAAHAVALVEKL